MKKLALIVIFLFFASFASAEVNILNQIEQVYNINEKVPLKLSITNSQEVDGFVKSSIICDNTKLDYFTTPFTFKTTPQEVTIPDLKLTKKMVGKCSLEVSLSDSENNLIDKKIAKVFDVSSDLILSIQINKGEFSPGEEIKITGTLKNIRGENINSGSIKISLDDKEFSTETNKGEFSYNYNIPSNIKSNSHLLKFLFEDGSGNNANKEFSIIVIPKPSILKLLLNKLDFLPEEKISIESLLYDQAGDLIENNAEIKIYDANDKLIRQGNGKLDFALDQYALPGSWLIKAKTDDFNIQSNFNVGEVKKVQVYIEDGIVYVKNMGNVLYDDQVTVTAIGQDGKEFTKKITLDPKDSQIIKLSDELKQGEYNVDVKANAQKESFNSVGVPEKNDPVYLTGKAVSTSFNNLIDKPYLSFLILLVVALLFYVTIKGKKRNKFLREKEMQHGYVKAREIEQQKIKSGITPRRFNIDEKEAKDFRDRILKNIEKDKRDQDKGNSFGF